MKTHDSALILAAVKENYEEDVEESQIYIKFKKNIPVFDEEKRRFVSDSSEVPRDLDTDISDSERKKHFYLQLMVKVNEIYAADPPKRPEKISEAVGFILKKLVSNPRHFQFSVVTEQNGKKKYKTPSSVISLQEELLSLTETILQEYSGSSPDIGERGFISYLKEKMASVKDYMSEKSSGSYEDAEILRRIGETDADKLRRIAELIAAVSVHNKIREYFYNAARNGRRGEDKAPRNKTIALLDSMSKDVNITESFRYVTLTDMQKSEALHSMVIAEKNDKVFIPMAADYFGNIVFLAGNSRLEYGLKNKNFCAGYIIKKAYTDHRRQVGSNMQRKKNFDSFGDALQELSFVTAESLIDLKKSNGHLLDDIRKYDMPDLPRRMSELWNISKIAESTGKKWEREFEEMMV